MADIREWMQACQNTLDAAVELATMLDEGITDTKLWPIEAREYAAMLLEDAITQWEDN